MAKTAPLSSAMADVFSTMLVPNSLFANADCRTVASVSVTSAT